MALGVEFDGLALGLFLFDFVDQDWLNSLSPGLGSCARDHRDFSFVDQRAVVRTPHNCGDFLYFVVVSEIKNVHLYLGTVMLGVGIYHFLGFGILFADRVLSLDEFGDLTSRCSFCLKLVLYALLRVPS